MALDRRQLPFTLVFVVGAPRSGTSLLQALVCTSPLVNPFVGECSYLTSVVWSMNSALLHFNLHTRSYFTDLAAVESFHADLVSSVVEQHWRSLAEPSVLALKDPNLTMLSPSLARWFPEARFLVATRDPRDVVASRVKVQQRIAPGSADHDFVLRMAHEYNAIYRHLLANRAVFGGRMLLVDYEALVTEQDIAGIARFLNLPDLDPAAVWQRSNFAIEPNRDNVWDSLLHYQPISANAIGSFRSVLDEATSAEVMAHCAPVFAELRRVRRD